MQMVKNIATRRTAQNALPANQRQHTASNNLTMLIAIRRSRSREKRHGAINDQIN